MLLERLPLSRKFFPIIGKPPKNIFQPLETFFPIIGKLPFSRRASRLAKTRAHFFLPVHDSLRITNDSPG